MPDEDKVSIGIFGWVPLGHPIFDHGLQIISTTPSRITFEGKSKIEPGVVLSLPGGGHNAVRFTYFQTTASGNFTAATDLNLWSTPYNAGEYLSTNYKLRAGKLSYEYVTWPYPIGSRKFRLKTLWEVQFAKVDTAFAAPLTGDPNTITGGSKTIILPTIGLGITEYLSKNVHVDLSGSGFGLPHRAGLADGNGSIALRFGRGELIVGGKAYYFKTTPQKDFYIKGTLAGAFVMLKYYLN